ncbi:MAG: HEAT repeat domain-containing protein [Chloroflexi bacterium]|nr:HEAT repeat domain-containing protein [Chloroflexota bacterium]
MNTKFDVIDLADLMAQQGTYEEAWTIGLEIQSFGNHEAFHYVLQNGSQVARRAAAFWLADEAEKVPAEIFLSISDDEDDDIRFHAAYGLGYVEHPKAVPTLAEMLLSDKAAEVRQTAAHSIYPAARLNNSIDNIIIKNFEKVLQKETNDAVREEIVTSLSYFFGTPVQDEAAKLLEQMTKDADNNVAVQAQISLLVLKNGDAARPIESHN